MTYLASWPPAEESALFHNGGLKRAGEYLTENDLEAQYGFMTDQGEQALRQQMQVMGRPLTRAEQRSLSGLGAIFLGQPTLLDKALSSDLEIELWDTREVVRNNLIAMAAVLGVLVLWKKLSS